MESPALPRPGHNGHAPQLLLPLTCAALAACAATTSSTAPAPEPIATELALETFDVAWETIEETHFDPEFNGVDWPGLRDELRPRVEQVATKAELREILDDMISRLGQSHFAVIPARSLPSESDAAEAAGGDGQAGNPGFDVRFRDGLLLVTQVDPGGSAQAAGVAPGMALVRVDESDVQTIVREEAARQLADDPDEAAGHIAYVARGIALGHAEGPLGSTAQFTFTSAGDDELSVELEREALGAVAHDFGTGLPTFHLRFQDEILEYDGMRVGRIHFSNWFLPMMRPIDEAIDRMRDGDGIIIDLRGNSGGAGPMTMGLAGHFFTDRRLFGTQKMRGGEMKYVAMPRLVSAQNEAVTPYAGPLAILIDETSASASEVFAGGLQSTGRARVFGETSAGAVLPARTTMLPSGDALLHALGDFRTAEGVMLEGVGVVPDEVIELDRASLSAGRDAPLEAALHWIATQVRP